MSGRSYFNSMFLLIASSLFIYSGCQNSQSAPTIGSTPKGATEPTAATKNSGTSTSDKNKSSPPSSVNEANKPADRQNPGAPSGQIGPLPEAKQVEVKVLFAGEWVSSCIKIENPGVAGQFFSATESWKLLADGTIEVTYHDFDDAACRTPTRGFESYVVGVSNPVAVKEIAAKHFYVEMNVLKELNDKGTLTAATGKFLIMVKFDVGSMTVDFADDTTATTLSAEAIKFTRK